jgi:hypothetical protein
MLVGLFLLGIAALACGDDGSAAESRLRLAALSWTDDAPPLHDLAIEVQAGDALHPVSGSDLRPSDQYAQPHSAWLAMPAEGAIIVRFTLDSESESEGAVVLEARPDWEWEVQFHIAGTDPFDQCFGCVGSEAFSLGAREDVRLYVVWGGNSISDPVVF